MGLDINAIIEKSREFDDPEKFREWWQEVASDPFSYWRSNKVRDALIKSGLIKNKFPDYGAIWELGQRDNGGIE